MHDLMLILRYNADILDACIDKHIDVLNKNGYCWFGKMGKTPSMNVISQSRSNDKGLLVLYSKTKSYLCSYTDISADRPNKGFPKYYHESVFGNEKEPKIYFKLVSIDEMKNEKLKGYVIKSSGKSFLDIINHTMCSYFLVIKENLCTRTAEIVSNNCIYEKEGKCGRKGFVSYQFECLRPSNCRGQKR